MSSTTMSLARAFTKRNKRPEMQMPNRSNTVKLAPGTINRTKISLPVELLSTTNVQALTAPDIRSISTSSTDSINSANDSDFSTIDRSFINGQGGETSSIDSPSPATPVTPADNDLKPFFDVKLPVFSQPIIDSLGSPEIPALPQRSPSHSKRAHVELSRKRSVQRLSPPPNNIDRLVVRGSSDIFTPNRDPTHPFGEELARVKEVAEEFGAVRTVMDEEEQELVNKGLHKFGVEEYLDEIAGLYGGIFDGRLGPIARMW